MKVGAVYPQSELGGEPEAIHRFGLAVEEMGFDYLLCSDHVLGASQVNRQPKLPIPYDETYPFHDPLVMLAYLAGVTRRIELATGVLVLPQRQTVLVARQAADIDLLSKGRLRLGVALGSSYVESEALGQDFRTRAPRLEEQITLLRQLWSSPLVDFTGEFHRIDRAGLNPRPTRRIPVWLGGLTEPAFARAARLGDGFIFLMDPATADAGWGRIRLHLQAAGRAEADFGRELYASSADGAREAADHAKAWRDLGGTHLCVPSLEKGLSGLRAHLDYLAEALHLIRG